MHTKPTPPLDPPLIYSTMFRCLLVVLLFFLGGDGGPYCITIATKENSKTTSRHRNMVEYIAGKSFLFISLKEKLDHTLFGVRRSQYFISHLLFAHVSKGLETNKFKNLIG